jgi:hypothetical protein
MIKSSVKNHRRLNVRAEVIRALSRAEFQQVFGGDAGSYVEGCEPGKGNSWQGTCPKTL